MLRSEPEPGPVGDLDGAVVGLRSPRHRGPSWIAHGPRLVRKVSGASDAEGTAASSTAAASQRGAQELRAPGSRALKPAAPGCGLYGLPGQA
jgi:hypothetical protein